MDGLPMFEALGPWPSVSGLPAETDARPPLEGSDLHCLHAAEGWIELGDSVEANRELDGITLEQRGHPDVMSVRWQIYAGARMWRVCLIIARILTERAPSDPRGWLALAETFFFMHRYQDAYTVAYTAALEFPESWLLLYATARYACRLGNATEAEQYLQLAMAVGDRKSVKERALSDPALAPIWKTTQRPRKARRAEK